MRTRFRPTLRPTLRPSFTALLAALIATAPSAVFADARSGPVAPRAEEIRPVLIGTTLPDASVKTLQGESIGLLEALGGKTTALIVYRGGWCPICNRQFSELRHAIEPLRELGVQMVAVSADSPERLVPTMEAHELGIPLLSDFDLHAAKALGLAFRVSDDYMEKLAGWGIDTEGNAVATEQVLPVPAVFVVDEEGTITFSYVNPNYTVRCDPDVLVAAARAATRRTTEAP